MNARFDDLERMSAEFGARPDDTVLAARLAHHLASLGMTSRCALVIRTWFEAARRDHDTTLQALELLLDCGRQDVALELAERELACDTADPRIHLLCANAALQLGDFERARTGYLHVVEHAPQAAEWCVADGLCHTLRYRDADHPDLQLFRRILEQARISPRARASTLLALAKAMDDLGDHQAAVERARQANSIRQMLRPWQEHVWEARIRRGLDAVAGTLTAQPAPGWTPLLVVGCPRSGTTLVADQLTRHLGACSRGELPWLDRLASANRAGITPGGLVDLRDAYARQLLRDDPPCSIYIDKNPINLLHVGLVLALWSNAQVIYCRRDPLDNAVSIWMQDFTAAEHAYCSRYDSIGAFMAGCGALMKHWMALNPERIHPVDYEDMVADPGATLDRLVTRLGLERSVPAPSDSSTAAVHGIASASVWQARQPVTTASVGRAAAYRPWLPELKDFERAYADWRMHAADFQSRV